MKSSLIVFPTKNRAPAHVCGPFFCVLRLPLKDLLVKCSKPQCRPALILAATVPANLKQSSCELNIHVYAVARETTKARALKPVKFPGNKISI